MNEESLHEQSTIVIEVMQNKCNTMSNDELPKECNNSGLDVFGINDVGKNGLGESQKNKQNQSSEYHEETCNTPSETLETQSISENAKENFPVESTPDPNARRKIDIQTTLNESPASPNSSSDEEILQSRFTVQTKNLIYDDKHRSPDHNEYNSPISSENNSNKDSIPENDSENKNISPIIIQAKACQNNQNNDISNCDSTTLNSVKKQTEINNFQETTTEDLPSGSSLYVEADNSNIESESNTMQNSTENDYELLNFNNRKDTNESMQQKMKPVAPIHKNDSFALDFERSSDISTNIVVQDFLNGSFDVNTYQIDRPLRSIEKSIASERNKFPESKALINMKQKNGKNTLESKNGNKKKYGLFPANNEVKQNNFNSNKNTSYKSETTLTRGVKRKMPVKPTKDTKKAKITKKEKNTTPARPKKSNPKSNSRSLSVNRQSMQVKDQLFNYDDDMIVLNNFNGKNEDKKNKKNRTPRRNNYKEEEMLNLYLNNNPVKNTRNKRNSSLIASRKIKEIERLENSDNDEVICLDSNETDFKLNKIMKNMDKYTNIFDFEKRSNGYEMENKLKNVFRNRNSSSVTSDSLQSYSARREKTENSRITRSNREYKNNFKDTFDRYHVVIKSPFKKDDKEVANKDFSSDTNLSGDCFIQENENLYENLCRTRKNKRKSIHNEKGKNKIAEISKTGKNVSQERNTGSIMHYEGAITRSKRKTWETLEKELLEELEEIPITNDICKTVILKKEKLIKKKNIKDMNLYTVSNRSIMQTISKSTKGINKHIQKDADNKHSEMTTNNAGNYFTANTFSTKSKEIVPSTSKTTTILERTIAAMERCTAQFIEPQVDSENEQNQYTFQFEDTLDDADINQETQFHSNTMTIIANKNEQYYKNEIVGYLRKSCRKKNTNSRKRNYFSETVDNLIHEDEYGSYEDAKQLGKISFVTKCLSESNPKESFRNESQALVPLSGEKHINPWDKLIRKIDQEQSSEKGIYPKDISINEENMQELSRRSPECKDNLERDLNTYSQKNDKMLPNMLLDEKEVNENKMNDIRDIEKFPIMAPNKETKLLVYHMPTSSNFNTTDNYNLNTDCGPKTNTDKRSKSDTMCVTKTVMKPVKKIKYKKVATQIHNIKSSPKFELQLGKSGNLKFKRNSKESSSITNSSEEFTESNKNIKHPKVNETPKNKRNEDREKYKSYYRKLFRTQDTSLEEDMTNDHDKVKYMEVESKDKGNVVIGKNRDQGKVKRKLITELDEDIFSLSSSDSEVDKNPGSGLLCELFDE